MDSRVSEMVKLREMGLSFREIGERYGVSKQAVCRLIGNVSRRYSVDIENIRYEGFYELFKNDNKMTFSRLARILSGSSATHAGEEKIRRFLVGECENVSFRITHIDNLLAFTGKTYEEMFKPRKH